MLILGLDVATVTGWSLYDTDRDVSAIVSGSFRTGTEDTPICDKLLEIRRQVPRLIKEHRPDFAAIEEPLQIIPRYKKAPKKKGLLSDAEASSPVDGGRVVALLRKGLNINQIAGQCQTTPAAVLAAIEPGGMNPKTTVMLSELAGGATVAVQGHNVPCVQVQPKTWQTVIPAAIKAQFSGEGATKKRAAAFCQALKIVSPNMDSRDACVIAIWAAGHCQELRMMQRAQEAA